MYLSIGNDMAVRESSIIGIFDMDNTSTSKRTRAFLEEAEKQGKAMGDSFLSVEHLFYGLLDKADGNLKRILQNLNVRLQNISRHFSRLFITQLNRKNSLRLKG